MARPTPSRLEWMRGRGRIRLRMALAVLLGTLGLLLASGLIFGASLTVSTTRDVVDGDTSSITNLIANPGADGKISLREAVAAANNTASTDTITVPAGTYTLTAGEIAITKSVIINGASAATSVISGNSSSRIFNVSATLTLTNMTLKNGKASTGNGGAILKKANTLTLTNVILDSNTSSNGAGGAVAGTGGTYSWNNVVAQNNKATLDGGALYTSAGTLKLTGNTLRSNTSANGAGGAIWFTGTAATIATCVFTSNLASGGNGGAANLLPSGSSTVTGSSFTSNSAPNGSGGGAYLSGAGVWTVTDTSFSSNTSPVGGGGAVMAGSGSVTSTHTRVTFDNNQAVNGTGGGLLVAPSVAGATTTLTNVTVYNNSANSGGGAAVSQGTLSLVNVTVANNSGPNGSGGLLQTGGTLKTLNTLVASNGSSNCAGSISTQGYNLDTGNSCSFSAGTDKRNAAATLGSFGNNGGNTQTVSILALSQAVNSGTATGAPAADQRGLTRVGTTDIGAYEFGAGTTGATISGTVFEDPNYGGGAGRDLATAQAAGGTGRPSARVELYDSSGGLARNTSSASDGSYSFTFLPAGSYTVRVVNSTVSTARSGWTSSLLPVQTYRTDAGTGTATAVADHVGGQTPSKVDADAGSTTLAGLATTTTAAQSVTAVVLGSTNITGVDFGYSFNVVVNTNDVGQGSLSQFVGNANALDNTGLAISGRTGGVDHAIFMLPDGKARAGLNTSYATAFSSGVATINLTDGLGITDPVVIDAQTQPGWSANPIVELNGSGAGTGTAGIQASIGGTTLRGLIINRFDGGGIFLDGGSNTVQGCWIGLAKTGTSASANNDVGLQIDGGSGDTIGGVGTSTGNVISGNASFGVAVLGSTTLIQGNRIGTNAAGTAKVANGNDGIQLSGAVGVTIGGTSAAARNVISGNDSSGNLGDGIHIFGGNSNVLYGNYIGTDLNGSAALGNYHSGVTIDGSSSNVIGGPGSGEANLIARNTGAGVIVTVTSGPATGNRISGNIIQNNGGLGIDLGDDGITANDGAKTTGAPNLLVDQPVFNRASLSDGTLTVAGYVGSAAGQSTFGGATVEVFISDTSLANGQGKTYLGSLPVDANGNFSGTISNVSGVTNGMTRLTGTATDGSGNTSEFGPNLLVGLTVSGTVFEDANYGGGAGRSLAASAGSGVSGATVELYDSNGGYVTDTTTASGGSYSFAGLAPGNYFVRVASSTVLSQRSGSGNTLLPVLTYRTTAGSGTAVGATDTVGGTNPAVPDTGVGAAGTSFSTSTFVFSAGLAGTAHAVALVTVGAASIGSVDFGFNFDTVVNTNASGQGSLVQAITNANALAGDGSLAQSGRTAGIENLVFMISNGTSSAGLRAAYSYFSGGVATITPAAALPNISSPLVLDAQTQPGWTANPVIELNGTGAGYNNGLVLNAAGSIARGLIINRWAYAGIRVTADATVQGNWLGTTATGLAASPNGQQGLELNGGAVTVGGTGTNQGNVISGNTGAGIWISGGTGHVIQGNLIGLGVDGSTRVGNAGFFGIEVYGSGGYTIGGAGVGNTISGQTGSGKGGVFLCSNGNQVLGNRIGTNVGGSAAVPNAGPGVAVCNGKTGNTVGGTAAGAGNLISGNGSHGIDASSSVTVLGNTIGMSADGSAALGNAGSGIWLSGGTSGSVIGGTPSGAPNWVAGNNGKGVVLATGESGVPVQRNRIFGNGGIAIDLGNDGVSVNDGAKTSAGANLLIDSPVFTAARATGAQLVVAGYVGSAAGQNAFANAAVEIYASDNSSSGFGGGKTYLGSAPTDAYGNFSATVTMPVAAVAIGTKLTGTATDGSGNTSEFGANFSGLIVDLVVNDNGDAADASAGDGYCATASGVCTLRAALAELNVWPGLAMTPTVTFAIPGCSAYGAPACAITPASALPTISQRVLLDGSTQAGFSSSSYRPIIELSGASAPAGTTGLVVSASNSTVRGLAINRFPAHGVTLGGSGNTLAGLRIGLAVNATATSANGASGVYVNGSGSLIGKTVGGVVAADANVIAGNTGPGVTLAAGTATLTGNFIGTDSSGTAGLGNGSHGVSVTTAGVTGISLSGNTIANNAGNGVGITGGSGTQVQVLGNVILGNGTSSGIGIDLGNNGVTANTGVTDITKPNKGMNAPVITGAGVGSAALTVYGYIGTGTGQAAFAGARVELFKALADSSGYGQGQIYLGFLNADSNGRFSGSVTFPAGSLVIGDVITATATDTAASPNANTSEFGPNRTSTSVAALTPGGFNAFDAATAAGALTGDITTKVAGAAASFAVIALDNSGSALHPGFTGSVSLTWVDARDDTGALIGSCRSSWVDKGAAGSASFSNNNRVTVSLTPPPAATRAMRLKMSYTANGSTTTACSNDAYAALPASLAWVNASDADSATAGTTRVLANPSASGGVAHKAGRPFTVRAQALDATGALMTGYDGSPVLAASGCLLPSGCTSAALTASTVSAVFGAYTHNAVSYAEVGALQLQLTDSSYASIDAADTALNVRTLTSSALSVGRFVPDAYTVAVSTAGTLATANSACMAAGTGATFIGQPFGWAATPQVTVTAVNAAGATTTRWTGNMMKLTGGAFGGIGLVDALVASATGSASLSATYGGVAVNDLGNGQARLTASSSDRFLLDVPGGTVQDSVTPTWAWSLALTDSSEAGVSGNPTLTASASQGGLAFNSGSVFHTARLSLSPAHGDVRVGIKALVQLQRYTAAGWVTLTGEQGCVTLQNQNVAVESPSGVFAALGSCAAPMSGAVTTKGGRAWLAFPGTPAGTPGRLTLRLAGAAARGDSCTAAGAPAPLVSLTPTWLLGGSSDSGPAALATWGRSQREALLRREVW